MTGITREKAAQVIAEYYGTTTGYAGTYYHTYTARDRKGRTWKAMSDGSIDTQRKVNGNKVSASGEYSCEVVTPILQYDDLEDLQNVVRALRAAGAFANSSCGIHVHVDGANHTPDSLTRLLTSLSAARTSSTKPSRSATGPTICATRWAAPSFKRHEEATDRTRRRPSDGYSRLNGWLHRQHRPPALQPHPPTTDQPSRFLHQGHRGIPALQRHHPRRKIKALRSVLPSP